MEVQRRRREKQERVDHGMVGLVDMRFLLFWCRSRNSFLPWYIHNNFLHRIPGGGGGGVVPLSIALVYIK